MANEEFNENSAPRWEERIPCVDESCIGTIATDGICRVCGKPYDGELPEFTPETEELPVAGEGVAQNFLEEPGVTPMADGVALATDADDDDSRDDEWANRKLCVDES